jgi:hypothetical protein
MGTSGAYGGSGAANWGDAHDLYEDVASAGSGAPDRSGQLATAIAQALRKANASAATSSSYDPGTLGARRGANGDGYIRSRTAGGAGSGARSGGGAGFGRRAARGGRALAGFQAYRAGDRDTLGDLGLDLDDLERLPNDRARCAAIADALVGVPAHPDDVALKSATIATMMEALKSGEDLDSQRLVELFVENLTYEQVLVELTSRQRRNPVTPAKAAKTEKSIRRYIRAAVGKGQGRRKAGGQAPQRLGIKDMVDGVAALAAKVLRVFGGGGKA